jgi:hypothetical protein
VVLDTLSRFLNIDENDNPAMTAACGMLEEVIEELSCNIIMLHHVNKSAGEVVNNDTEMYRALSQSAIRGASSLAGAARFAIVFAPLSKGFASSLFGEEAKDKPSGSYLAIRAPMKNIGPPEPPLFFVRGDGGLLERVEAKAERDELEKDAYKLAEEVKRREEAGELPLSFSRGYQDVFDGGTKRSKKVAEKALALGLVDEADRKDRNGKVLKSRSVTGSWLPGTLNFNK